MFALTFVASEIWQLLTAFGTLFAYFLNLSGVLGDLLVRVLVQSVKTCLTILKSLQEFCVIFGDDYSYFIYDIYERIAKLVLSVNEGGWWLYRLAAESCLGVSSAASALFGYITDIYEAGCLILATFGNVVSNCVTILLDGVSFIGSTVVTVCVVLPKALIDSIITAPKVGSEVVWSTLNRLSSFVTKLDQTIYQVLASIPINAVIGCTVTTVICYFIYYNLPEIATYGMLTAERSIVALCRLASQCWNGEFFENRRQNTVGENVIVQAAPVTPLPLTDPALDQALCIICLTAPKNVLYMPCRHACVCKGCNDMLDSDLCPLCRKIVRRKMLIFI